MADLKLFKPWSVNLGAVSSGFRNARVGGDNLIDSVRSDGATYTDLVQQMQKRPVFSCELLDPSLITSFQAIGAGETYTSLSAIWRAISDEAGPAGSYLSFSAALAAIMPVSLQAPFGSIATLEVQAMIRFNGGVGYVIGTSSGTQATVAKAFRASSLAIGSDTVLQIQSAAVQWQHNTIQEELLEPDHYGYDSLDLSGSAQLSDLALVNIARLEDGSTETVTLTLTDLNDGGNTVAISFGSCDVKAEISGKTANITWTKLQG